MVRVRMTKDMPVSEDGLHTVTWHEGEEHIVTNDTILAALNECEACEIIHDGRKETKAETPETEQGAPVARKRVTKKAAKKNA